MEGRAQPSQKPAPNPKEAKQTALLSELSHNRQGRRGRLVFHTGAKLDEAQDNDPQEVLRVHFLGLQARGQVRTAGQDPFQ